MSFCLVQRQTVQNYCCYRNSKYAPDIYKKSMGKTELKAKKNPEKTHNPEIIR